MANLDLSKYGIVDVKAIRLMMFCSQKKLNRVWKASRKAK